MCTGMTLKARNGDLFFGRTLDLDVPMFGEDTGNSDPVSIMTIPKNKKFPSQLNAWETKYSVLGIAITDSTCLFDGINTEGLVGDCQVLKETTWMSQKDFEKTELTPCLGEEFVAYILTNYATVKEIKDNIDSYCIYDQEFVTKNSAPAKYPLHYSFVDATGEGIVLEPVNNGTFKVYDYLGVMANSPEYDYHQVNIRNYIGLQNVAVKTNNVVNSLKPIEGGTGYGLVGLPGDYTSPSRFVKSYFIANFIDSFDSSDGINQLYSAFRPLIIPRGLEHTNADTPRSDFTRYWSGYDVSRRELFVQSCVGLAITGIKISDISLEKISYKKISVDNNINYIV